MHMSTRILATLKAFFLTYLLYKAITIIWSFQDYLNYNPVRGEPYAWKSSYSGWYTRSTSLNTSQIQHIHLDVDSLVLVSSSTAWGSDKFNLALFKPGICVLNEDARRLNESDFEGVVGIVEKFRENGRKTRHWNMHPGVFDISTKELRIWEKGNSVEGGQLQLYSAYGLNKFRRFKGSARLPEEMAELFGLFASDEILGQEGGEVDEERKTETRRLVDKINNIAGLEQQYERRGGGGRRRGEGGGGRRRGGGLRR